MMENEIDGNEFGNGANVSANARENEIGKENKFGNGSNIPANAKKINFSLDAKEDKIGNENKIENEKIKTENIGSGFDANKNKFVEFAKSNFIYIAFAFLAIIFLSGSLHSDMFGWIIPDVLFSEIWNPVTNTGIVPSPDKNGWIYISAMAMLIMALVGAIAYLLSGILGQRVSQWGKSTLYEVAKCALILVFVSAAFVAVNSRDAGPLMVAGYFQVTNALHFAETVRNTIMLEFVSMTTVTAILSLVGNLTPYFRPAGIIGISFSLSPAFRPIFDSLGIMLSSLSVAVGTWYLQIWFLMFVQNRLMVLFMPIGLFLRCFQISRPGNILIAIAIGFYFVYPFVMNVGAIAMQNDLAAQFATPEVYESTNNGQEFADFQSCYDYSSSGGQGAKCFFKLATVGPLNYLKSFLAEAGLESLLTFGVVQLLTGSLPASIGVSFVAMFTISMLATTLFYVLIVSILMPLFNIFITLTVIKELTKVLGSEIDFSAFEKIF